MQLRELRWAKKVMHVREVVFVCSGDGKATAKQEAGKTA
jgi:hypothetical protein